MADLAQARPVRASPDRVQFCEMVKASTKRTLMNIHARANIAVPRSHTGFDRMPIGTVRAPLFLIWRHRDAGPLVFSAPSSVSVSKGRFWCLVLGCPHGIDRSLIRSS